jgi:hypothetical protein
MAEYREHRVVSLPAEGPTTFYVPAGESKQLSSSITSSTRSPTELQQQECIVTASKHLAAWWAVVVLVMASHGSNRAYPLWRLGQSDVREPSPARISDTALRIPTGRGP